MKSLLSLIVLLLGCGELKSPTAPSAPACSHPAPFFEYKNPVPNSYIVDLNDDVNVRVEAERLAAKYGFRLTGIFEYVIGGFSAVMDARALAGVRCESTVRRVDQDIYGAAPGDASPGAEAHHIVRAIETPR